jgi:hypothetical protein
MNVLALPVLDDEVQVGVVGVHGERTAAAILADVAAQKREAVLPACAGCRVPRSQMSMTYASSPGIPLV